MDPLGARERRGPVEPFHLVTWSRLAVTVVAMLIGGVLALRGDAAGIALVSACAGYWLGSPTDRRLDR